MRFKASVVLGAALLSAACATQPVATAPQAAPPAVPAAPAVSKFTVPVEYHRLDNGLKVVLSPDPTTPTAVVGVYYNIGFRIEPRDRTGFAHLFEHMMFQGSENLGKMEFIKLVQSNGGVLNGSTRFDFTNYFQIVPSNAVETMLWAEADRMRGLAITQDNLTNQQAVVKNEVRVNVLNQPYGGFPWLDLPQYANTNWYNAHNFYGDLEDLDAATLEDVRSFFRTYYAPNNAVVVVTGDINPAETLGWIRKYFSPIPPVAQPAQPDISEPRQEQEKRFTKEDKLANRPALAIGWQMPKRGTPEYYAMGLLSQLLSDGRDSELYQELVQRKGLTGEVDGGINLLGNMFNINGPVLYTVAVFHDKDKSSDQIISTVDSVVERVRTTPVSTETLSRLKTKMRSNLYDQMEALSGFGKMDLLAVFALFDDDPSMINRLEEGFEQVTPELLQRTAQEYLRPTNRTILMIDPKAAS
jgi:zinc protease